MERLIERVWEHSKNSPYGFTLDLESLREVRFGIVVAFKETQGSFGRQSLMKVIGHALENDKKVGGWLNDEDGLYYFDSVKVFKNSDLREAMEFGIENDQIAIFDLTNLREIRLR